MKDLQNFTLKLSLILTLPFLLSTNHSLAQKQKQLWFRSVQHKNANLKDNIIRIYYDKYGNYYPDLSVPIDSVNFFNPDYAHQYDTDSASANLYYYFKKFPAQIKFLAAAYHVKLKNNIEKDYPNIQEKEIAIINDQIHALVKAYHAKKIIIMIHGFNDPDATVEYGKLISAIQKSPYAAAEKPVFIEIFWDGLHTNGDNTSLPHIWAHAQENTRWIALSLRDFMNHIKDQLPIVIITHSLGASIGTGALFNTMHKWNKYNDKLIDDQLDELQKTPTLTKVNIRLAMLAPAIPGESTFVDFDDRDYGKSPIKPSLNNIDRIVIGYNPLDFATSKRFFNKQPPLAGHFGATTLGCDYGYPNNGQDELNRVRQSFMTLGYSAQVDRMLFPIKFTTAKAFNGTQQHALEYYLKDTTNMKIFLTDIFAN